MNQLIMIFHGTKDARGFRQWKEAKRHVKKGSKSFQILVPCFKKQEGEEEKGLVYFTTCNVFKVEDTDGEPLDYEQLVLPDLPLLDLAKEWVLEVQAIGGNSIAYGYYQPTSKIIGLATPQEKTFSSSLCTLLMKRALANSKPNRTRFRKSLLNWEQLLFVALWEKTQKDTTGNSYRYIET